MSSWRFILRSLAHHWRINASVALGVAAATAVLTGALLVGDSVRGSLKRLTLDRLGRIDELLVTDRFFRQELADELEASPEFKDHYESAVAAIIFPRGSVESKTGPSQSTRRAAGVLVVGCDASFWELGESSTRPEKLPRDDEIVLNAPLADELGVAVGDTVTLRLVQTANVPADSPLGKKEVDARSLTELTVVDIIPAESLGSFGIRPSQTTPRNAYVSLEVLQDRFDQPGKANTIFVSGKSPRDPPDKEASKQLASLLRPTLEDYGYSLTRIRRTFPNEAERKQYPELADKPEQVVYDYFSFTCDRMIIQPEAETAAEHAFAADHAQPVFVYLANRIAKVNEEGQEVGRQGFISYSTVAAVDSTQQLGPLLVDGQPLDLQQEEMRGEDEKNYIVLNSWTADDLGVKPKDTIRITYFLPETTHGKTEDKHVDFELKAILPLTAPGPDEKYQRKKKPLYQLRPTLLNDPDFTPVVEGITDQQSISSWEVPFEIEEKIRDQDEDYWDLHRTTPKAFVSLARGQEFWGSRFGRVTSYRIPIPAAISGDDEQVAQMKQRLEKNFIDQIHRDGAALGFQFIPIKRNGLQPSVVANYFNGLFLGFSMFIIAAALMLVSLLFRLGVQQRAGEIGILQAVGLRRGRTARLLVREGAIVASLGALLGVAVGIGYAWLMIVGLRTWWVGAVSTPFLRLYLSNPLSLLIGYASGVLVSVLTIRWSIRQTRKLSIRRLLLGQVIDQAVTSRAHTAAAQVLHMTTFLLFAGAIGLLLYATQLGGEAQAGAFLGGGACVLTAVLIFIWTKLRYTTTTRSTGRLALPGLARRNAGRNPSRSTLAMGLIAAASFLIVAVNAFRLAPSEEGTGGFALMGQSDPFYRDLDDAEVRSEILGEENAALLKDKKILSLRLRPGDDASCNNLYASAAPRVIGVTQKMVEHFDNPDVPRFAWAANAAQAEADKKNPWRLLQASSEDDTIPVVIDKNTAMYSLQLYKGIGEEFDITFDEGPKVKFRVVGLLSNSVLQGTLLIGEADFEEQFPGINGYRMFLFQAPPDQVEKTAAMLEDRMSDQLLDVQSTHDLLVSLLAVQNTYLDTFQSLGALGLLLGTFGLATVQLRNVLERRGELALMRAAGFRRGRLAGMVMAENAVLLVGGLAIGVFSALLAVVPHWVAGGASAPGVEIAGKLLLVLVVGLATSLLAVRSVLRAPLLPALRGE